MDSVCVYTHYCLSINSIHSNVVEKNTRLYRYAGNPPLEFRVIKATN